MNNSPEKLSKVSIIIRSKNEEKWISSCLASIYRQEFTDFEVILVDNNSTDRTVEKAEVFGLKKIVNIDEFLPGKALNLGIREAVGDYIVCISSHCIPVNPQWLGNLLKSFDDDEIAGVYGRQEPMAFTSDIDKRDLINIFGLDRKVQKKDPFFHNANSMIRRDIWQRYPFSETTTNIEDRIWAKEILDKGFKIVYEPSASVYHYHGINQGRNIERAKNVVRILEELHDYRGGRFNIDHINVVAVIPVRAPIKYVGETPLLELALKSINKSKYVNKIIVAADDEIYIDFAESMGAEVILRPQSLSHDYIELIKIYQYVLNRLLERERLPDLVVQAQEKFPFRHHRLVDSMIEKLVNSDRDSVMAATAVYRSLWQEKEGQLIRIDQGFMPSRFKDPLFMGLYGLGHVMESSLVMKGEKLGNRAGLVMVDNPYSSITASTQADLKMVEALLPQWFEYISTE